MLLENKVAIVTGGTRGIGLSIVREFLKEGAAVVYDSGAEFSKSIEKTTSPLMRIFLLLIPAFAFPPSPPCLAARLHRRRNAPLPINLSINSTSSAPDLCPIIIHAGPLD